MRNRTGRPAATVAELSEPASAADDTGGGVPGPHSAEPGPAGQKASSLGLFAAAMAVVWPLAYSPALFSPVWAPKYAGAILIAGVGIPLLPRHRGAAGWTAAGFLLVAVASTLASANPTMSVVGLWNWGTGLLLVASMVGAWCLGRSLTGSDRALLQKGLLASTVVVAVLALIQMVVNLGALGLPLVFGRSTALQGNPVYLGAFLVIGLTLAACRLADLGVRWVPLVALIAAAMAVAQGRVTLLIASLIPIAVLRRGGLRRALLAVGAIAAGWLLGVGLTLVSTVDQAPGERSEAPASTVAVNTYVAREGIGPRLEVWQYSRHALLRNPAIGSGPGRFWAATVPDRTIESTRYSVDSYYSDPHNFVVEYAITTGLVGLALLLGWLVLSARGAAGPFAYVALALAFLHLLQPQNVLTTPLAFLALGAAAQAAPRRVARPWPSLVGGFVAAGLALALLVGHFALRNAYLTFDAAEADLANTLLYPWPEVADRRGLVAASSVNEGLDPDWDRVRHHFVEATRRDPEDPRPWLRLGDFEFSRGRLGAAESAYRRAQGVDPWNLRAARGLANLAEQRGADEEAAFWRRRAAAVRPG